MTSITEEKKFIDANFITISNFKEEHSTNWQLSLSQHSVEFYSTSTCLAQNLHSQMQNGKLNLKTSWQVRPKQ